ncbi:uncharacterized protein K441DRAFT_211885 [Cenococcum geophilum 1.58]|uniref:uncharacterized protein n=1 Tax=Cenococcum geophilum 1.58 TaxID=794803 RepID=UPI00358E805D|nr:hypothetical protein K441DRAFT_211885 [Cenococcum geophilum 1.58]
MEYHVILVNNSIALDPAHTYGDDKFIMVTLAFVNTIQSPTTYGGLWLVLNRALSTSEFRRTGRLPLGFLHLNMRTAPIL